MREARKEKLKEIIIFGIFFGFLLPIIFLIYKIIVTPTNIANELSGKFKGDYIITLLQCLLGLTVMIVPIILSKKFKLTIPTNMYLVFVIFLYGSIFFGEVRSFYYRVPHWDLIMHTLSGVMLGALGFSMIVLLNKENNIVFTLSPAFVAIFSFCFAIMLGVIWEIYEFLMDGILGLNMQKFMLESGEKLMGRAAISDTMGDLIVDSIGAATISIVGYISLKYKKGWLKDILIRIKTTRKR